MITIVTLSRRHLTRSSAIFLRYRKLSLLRLLEWRNMKRNTGTSHGKLPVQNHGNTLRILEAKIDKIQVYRLTDQYNQCSK